MNGYKRKGLLAVVLACVMIGMLMVGLASCKSEEPVERSYSCNVYTEQGCAKFIVASGGEIEVQSGATIDIQSGATTDFGGVISAPINEEHIGLPSVVSAAVTYVSTGALFTIADGEIWLVERCIINVTTNFDCTGDNCTLDLGDGTDTDGFLNMADADVQAAATDYTGSPAGWQGLDGATPLGVFSIGGPHIYAPSGAAETIDIAIGGTSPAAGAGTVYCIYTRWQ